MIESTVTIVQQRLEGIRDAMAAIYARSAAGDADSIQQAAMRLSHKVNAAQADCARLQRLLSHLGVQNMSEGAQVLCAGGRKEAAHKLMHVHRLTISMSTALMDVSNFIEECLNSLGVAQAGAQRQARGGRFLGSA